MRTASRFAKASDLRVFLTRSRVYVFWQGSPLYCSRSLRWRTATAHTFTLAYGAPIIVYLSPAGALVFIVFLLECRILTYSSYFVSRSRNWGFFLPDHPPLKVVRDNETRVIRSQYRFEVEQDFANQDIRIKSKCSTPEEPRWRRSQISFRRTYRCRW